jgi:hypothetical protein
VLAKVLAVAAAVAAIAFATPAHASVAFEHHRAVWIAGDDGSGPRRLAGGYEPRLAPGGTTVVYRDRTGTRVYAVPPAGGPRRRLLDFHVPRARRFSVRIAPLDVDFSSDGRRALVSLPSARARLIDLAAGRVRRLSRWIHDAELSPDGRELAWVRDRAGRCDVAVLALASGRSRSLRRAPCLSGVSWDGTRIALASWGLGHTHVSLVDPASGSATRVLSSRRVLGLLGTSPSDAVRLLSVPDGRHALGAWLVLPGGRRVVRPLPQLETIGASDDFVFTPDDQAVIVQENTGRLVRIALADGARQPLPIRTDGPFDAL